MQGELIQSEHKIKTVALWGARMTGLGAYRKVIDLGYDVKYFIDSDEGLWGLQIFGRRIISPREAKALFSKGHFEGIFITAILKAADIRIDIAKLFEGERPPFLIEYGNRDEPSYTIDIMGTCNLKCGSCPHSIEGHEVPKGSMTFETFQRVLDKALQEAPNLSHISLYSWGEPLLHPKLPQIINLAHERGLAVAVSSNLSLNLDARLGEIVHSCPDYFKISLSGYSQEVYQSTHQGGDINLVKSNLFKMRHLMDKQNKQFLVDINYHLYRNNHGEELRNFKSLAKDLGFALSETFALVMPLERVFDHLDGKPDYHTQKLDEELLLVTVDEGIEASGGRTLGARPCTYLENQVNINADLSVPLCCLTFERNERTIVAGNYLERSVDDIQRAKSLMTLCTRCQSEGLPEYNLGFNSRAWKQIASKRGYPN